MKVYSKNGIKFKISPKRWFDINCWLWVLDQCEAVESSYIPSGKHIFTNGIIEDC